jgi:hypothetical protein
MNTLKFIEEVKKVHQLSLEMGKLYKLLQKNGEFEYPIPAMNKMNPRDSVYGKFPAPVLEVAEFIFANASGMTIHDKFKEASGIKTGIEYINDHWMDVDVEGIIKHHKDLGKLYQYHLLRKVTDALTPWEMTEIGFVDELFKVKKANEGSFISDPHKGYFMAYKRAAEEESACRDNLKALRYLLDNVPTSSLVDSAYDFEKPFLFICADDVDELDGLIDKLPAEGIKKQGSRRIPFYPPQLAVAALLKNKMMNSDMRKKIRLIFS